MYSRIVFAANRAQEEFVNMALEGTCGAYTRGMSRWRVVDIPN